MTRVFLDANVLVAVLLEELNRSVHSARVLSLASNPIYQLSATSMSIGVCAYFAGKRLGDAEAKRRIQQLMRFLHIIPCDEKEAGLALSEKAVHDIEDGLQYFAALHANCAALITYNTDDFYFSKIPVYTPGDFLYQLANDKNNGTLP